LTREFTPEDIRNIGSTTIPAVAASYGDLQSLVADAKSSVDATFGDFITGSAAENFNTLWGRFATMAQETPDTLADMGRTLVEIADRYDEDEEQTALDLETAFSDLENVYTTNSAEPDQ
jgi:uncharacterized protein YukE